MGGIGIIARGIEGTRWFPEGCGPLRNTLWVVMEFRGCHSKALRGLSGEWTSLLADAMAHRLVVARAFLAHKVHQRLLAVQCIHVFMRTRKGGFSVHKTVRFSNSVPTRNRA